MQTHSAAPATAPAPAPTASRSVLIVALVAGATIGLELVQTRVLSVLYYNHVVYLTVTIALMGFGISGVLVSLGAGGIRDPQRWISRLLLGFALSVAACIAVASHVPVWLGDAGPVAKLAVSYLVLVVPFAFSGAVLGLVFMTQSQRIHALYGADLAASALVVILFGLVFQRVGATGLVLACAAAALIAYLLQGMQQGRVASHALTGLLAAAALAAASPWLISTQPEPYKTAGKFFAPERVADTRLERGVWTTIAKIDVWTDRKHDLVSGAPLPEEQATNRKMITQDADAHTILWGPQRLAELQRAAAQRVPYVEGAASMAYLLKPSVEHALVIGVGGGNDIIAARAYGARQITGVELNPATVALVRGPYRQFTQWPDWEGVTLVRGEGRNYVRRHKGAFDTLVMSGVDTFSALNSGAYVLSENYLYTVEAMHDYLDAVEPDGIVSIYRWLFPELPRENLRLTNLAATALAERGVAHPEQHIMVIGEGDWAATLFRKTPFTPAEVREAVAIVARAAQLAMIFVPKVLPHGEQADVESKAFAYHATRLKVARAAYAGALDSNAAERARFIDSYPFLVTPVYDARPFFFEYAKDEGSLLDGSVSELRGNAVRWTLHIMLVVLTLASVVAMFGPLVVKSREGLRLAGAPLLWLFFASLGVGFMLIEIGLMQWLNLFLGDPMRSLMVVLGSLLLFAGLGSMLAGRWRADTLRKITLSMTLVALAVPLWLVVIHQVVPLVANKHFNARAAVALLSLLPLGLLMGIPFASGLAYVQRVHPRFVPWAWGINGLTSVMASILVIILAMRVGFNAVVLLGAGVYLVGAAAMALHARRYAAPSAMALQPAE